MFSLKWRKAWRALFQLDNTTPGRRTASPRLLVEQLEDRVTPSATPTLDLSTRGSIGEINDAIFRQVDPQPTGTGVIDSFVRIQSIKGAVQQGYNTDFRKVQFDENTSPQFTRSLTLSSIPVVTVGGVQYREFLLDINQKASQPLLSLDELRLYVGGAGNLHGYSPFDRTLSGLNAVYDLDDGGDNWILLNARLNQGSGKGDMLAYIPDSLFTGGGDYVYLYSKFGVNRTSNSGFEEWATGRDSITPDTGSISGFVYNSSSTPNAPLVNQEVFIDANGNDLVDANEVFTFTNSTGYYEFDFLATSLGIYSTYTVKIVPPPTSTGITETVQGTPVTYPYGVSLQTNGQTVSDVNFYVTFPTQTTYTISGNIFDNGFTFASWTVTLTDTTTSATQTATGTANGSYSFGSLAAGHDYTVSIASAGDVYQPLVYTFTGLSANQVANFSSVPL